MSKKMTPREILEKAGKEVTEQNYKMTNIILEKENEALKEMVLALIFNQAEDLKELEEFLFEPITVEKVTNFIKRHNKE
jgi:hypothetical protein